MRWPSNAKTLLLPLVPCYNISIMKNHLRPIIITVIIVIVVAVVSVLTYLAIRASQFEDHEEFRPQGSSASEDCPVRLDDGECMSMDAKPIIYLYPETQTEISVSLGRPEFLTTTYPEYHNGWQVLAQSSGHLTNLSDNRELYALYWEGQRDPAHPVTVKDDGFIVAREDSIAFLEEKLAILGLSPREADEFIIYWLPRLRESAYNYIRFETQEEIDSYMPLTVSPEPDTIIRVLMDYLPLETAADIKISEQVLPPTPQRQGFTVVEWGGTKIEDNQRK